MDKRGLFVFALVFAWIFAIAIVSASADPNITTSENTASITTNNNDIYSYEVNYDYAGTTSTATHSGYLGEDGNGATYGSTIKNNILSVYGSKLDASAQGVNTDGELFTLSDLDATATLRYAYFILNDTSGIYVYYNNTAEEVRVADRSPLPGGSSGGGTSKGATYTIESDTMVRGIEKSLEAGDSFKFRVDGTEAYKLVVLSIGEGVVTINIVNSSLDILKTLTLKKGEQQSINILGTETPDIFLMAVDVDSNDVSLFLSDYDSADSGLASKGIKYNVQSVPYSEESSNLGNRPGVGTLATVSHFFANIWSSIANFFRGLF